MDRRPLKSSNIKSAGYDPASRTLEIEFHNGDVWSYKPVPPEHHTGLLAAESPGAYFHAHIKSRRGLVVTATP